MHILLFLFIFRVLLTEVNVSSCLSILYFNDTVDLGRRCAFLLKFTALALSCLHLDGIADQIDEVYNASGGIVVCSCRCTVPSSLVSFSYRISERMSDTFSHNTIS